MWQEDPELKIKLSSSPNTPAMHFPSACPLSIAPSGINYLITGKGTNKNAAALRQILKEQQNRNEDK